MHMMHSPAVAGIDPGLEVSGVTIQQTIIIVISYSDYCKNSCFSELSLFQNKINANLRAYRLVWKHVLSHCYANMALERHSEQHTIEVERSSRIKWYNQIIQVIQIMLVCNKAYIPAISWDLYNK
jgi:hypothetical protein